MPGKMGIQRKKKSAGIILGILFVCLLGSAEEEDGKRAPPAHGNLSQSWRGRSDAGGFGRT